MDHQGVGVSWECAASGHGGCHLAGCRCACHYRLGAADEKVKIDRVQTDINRVATPPMEDPLVREMSKPNPVEQLLAGPVCSKCGLRGREGDRYCRRDGSPIAQVHCGQCGVASGPGDIYCGSCGYPLTEEIAVKSAKPRARRVSQSTSTNTSTNTITNNNHE